MEIIKGIDGNNLIKNKILSKEPFIATKLGAVEQSIIISKLNNNYNSVRDFASKNAGITPSDDNTLNFFFENYIESLRNCDMIGCMEQPNEQFIINKYAQTAIYSELRYLEPFYYDNPWSESLAGLNVLVIHPFEQSILKQYLIREKLFVNKKILPEFNLLTIRSEQTNGGGRSNSKSFVESLDIMKNKIDNIDFDVALIGCGAYGLLLSSYIKLKNKQAIHIGGGLQILFGIKGKRWDVHPEISSLYNENWCRPMDDEKTINIQLVEGGTYW
jgi:hypothetical protein